MKINSESIWNHHATSGIVPYVFGVNIIFDVILCHTDLRRSIESTKSAFAVRICEYSDCRLFNWIIFAKVDRGQAIVFGDPGASNISSSSATIVCIAVGTRIVPAQVICNILAAPVGGYLIVHAVVVQVEF